MSLRPSVARGLGLAALLALGSAFVVPSLRAEEKPKDVRLLVSCDAAARPKVLEALRGLDVTVHDLATMERVPLPDAAPRAPATPQVDAFLVFREVMAAVDAARTTGGPDKSLTIASLKIGAGDTYLTGIVSAVDLVDTLGSALHASIRLGAPRPQQHGPVAYDPKGAAYHFTLIFPTPAAPSVPEAPRGSDSPSTPGLVNAVQRASGNIKLITALQVDTTPTSERRSQTVVTEPVDRASVERILKEVAEMPGALLVGLSWSPNAGSGVSSLTFKLTVTVPR